MFLLVQRPFQRLIVFVIDRENKLDFLFFGKNDLMYCGSTNYAGLQK
jgi:hypothetical protein